MQKCKLCHKKKELRNSHIFPEFLYSPLYDNNHQYFVVSSDSSQRIKKPRKGIYEKLFCSECEAIIEKYEDYAAKVLFSDGKTEIGVRSEEMGFRYFGIDYDRFKLFQISLLWRASISTRPEMHHINLGSHSDKIRLMILKRNPGETYRYGAGLFFIPNYSKKLKAFIYPPEKIPRKIEGHRFYRAIFNGLLWIFIVSSHSYMYSKKHIFLTKEGELPVTNIGPNGKLFLENLAHNIFEERLLE